MNKKKYILEPDLVDAGRYYIIEHGENHVRTAIVIYHDFDLAVRILDILNKE
jgi:hypothetical protein